MFPTIPPIQPPSAPPIGSPSTGGAGGSGGATGGFANSITNAIDQLQQTQNQASAAETQAAAGQGNVADALVKATEASLSTQVTVALTNRAISAFTQVMNLQI